MIIKLNIIFFFFSSRRRHTRYWRDWSSDVCSSDLDDPVFHVPTLAAPRRGDGAAGAVAIVRVKMLLPVSGVPDDELPGLPPNLLVGGRQVFQQAGFGVGHPQDVEARLRIAPEPFLAVAQGRFGLLLGRDVDRRHHPLDQPIVVVHDGGAPDEEEPMDAVVPTYTALRLIEGPGESRFAPAGKDLAEVVRMDRLRPTPAEIVLGSLSRIGAPGRPCRLELGDLAVRRQAPHE